MMRQPTITETHDPASCLPVHAPERKPGTSETALLAAIVDGVEDAALKQVGRVHIVPAPAQLIGERDDARGQALCMVENHYLSHLYTPFRSRRDPASQDSRKYRTPLTVRGRRLAPGR